jgi:sugar phosphate isomerase/epimerase
MLGTPSRREWLTTASVAVGTGLGSSSAAAGPQKQSFQYCFNTSTVRGKQLPLLEVIEIAARAGYAAVEPWIDEVEKYQAGGGSLKNLAKRIRDHGLVVADAIAFPEWVVDDEAARKKGLEKAKRAMDLVRQIGGSRIAAPPAGATNQADLNLLKAAERYRTLLEIGDSIGVVPQVEVWGFSKALGRLGEAALVAIESHHPRACVLADVFHLYKGGSGYEGLRLLSAQAMQVIHMNDYPADPPRATITDAYRVYPGDGVAPLKAMLRELRRIGFAGYLSLELFNPTYYKQDAFEVARTGLAKMRAVVEASAQS